MSEHKDSIAILLLVVLVLAVFWRATLGGIFYFGDIYQLHYPLHSAYAREVTRLALPLWTTEVLAGYPLLAEGQLGALYPVNWILATLLPVPIALNIFILGHFLLAALGAYAFARRMQLRRTPALCAGLVYALGGFLVAHLNHVNVVACAAWLPWLFLLTDRLLLNDAVQHHARDAVLLALVIALEFLAGHVQIAVLTFLAVAAYALYLSWVIRPKWAVVASLIVASLLGLALAAAQLLPSYELTQLSVRAGGLDPAFFTSFSLHPLYLVSLLSPFVRGNPYPNTSVELVGYVGWLPLLAALAAPWIAYRSERMALRPVHRTRFFAVLAIVALLLAVGRWNPLYMAMLRLPLFNLFRVPARYLYLFAFSAAMLAALGLDALLRRVQKYPLVMESRYEWAAIAVVALLVLLGSAQVRTADGLVAVWRWLPVILAASALAWLALAWWRKASYGMLSMLALALIVSDLIAFNAVFERTYNQTMPLKDFSTQPRSLSFFRSQAGLQRLYTSEEIVPVLSVMRESYYPNIALIHGLQSANGLFPLVPARYADYVEQMTPRMLDLLGVGYYLIPQVLPVDEASEFYDVEDRFALNPVGRTVSIPPTQVAAVEVESYLSHSVDWPAGQAVAEIRLRGAHDELQTITLRAGLHTAEWAYDRSDVNVAVRHPQAPVLRSWPARSGFPAENHRGYVYGAAFWLPTLMTVQAVEVHPLVPSAYLRIERLILVDGEGKAQQLAHLAGKSDHTLIYRSEDVAIYRNHDVLSRAFVVHQARAVLNDAETLRILRDRAFDPRVEVLLATESVPANPSETTAIEGAEFLTYDARRVVVKASLAADGYLVLTDAWYPGWRAFVDGREVPILRADLIFRAVAVPAGEHEVEFTYAPQSFRTGVWLTVGALLALVALWAWSRTLSRS